MSVFVHAHSIKTVHAGGGGVKNDKILSTLLLNAPKIDLLLHFDFFSFDFMFYAKSCAVCVYVCLSVCVCEKLFLLYGFGEQTSRILGFKPFCKFLTPAPNS